VIEVREVSKTYRKGTQLIRAVDGVSCTVDEGELVVVHGPSGSGKSTLLLMIGGMLPPDSGSIRYESDDVYRWPPRRRNAYRKHTVGFVFQRFFLVPYLTVFDNIRVPLVLQGDHGDHGRTVRELARRLRIEHRLAHRPTELSVGEQQRAAVARALVGGQKLILADEPTGNLDAANVEIIAECFRRESRRGRAILLVTHSKSLIGIGTKHLCLEAGRLIGGQRGESG